MTADVFGDGAVRSLVWGALRISHAAVCPCAGDCNRRLNAAAHVFHEATESGPPPTPPRHREAPHNSSASTVWPTCGSLTGRIQLWKPGTAKSPRVCTGPPETLAHWRPLHPEPDRLRDTQEGHSTIPPPGATTAESDSLQRSFDCHAGGWGDSARPLVTRISQRHSSTSHRTPNDIKLDLRMTFAL